MTDKTQSDKAHNDGLDDELVDKLVSLGKGATGLIPMVGGPLAEIIGNVIPGQRAGRVAKYLRALSARVEQLESTVQETLLEYPEKVDLIEEGGYQAARATSSKRIEMIVEAVSRGLTLDDADLVRRKRLLTILGELDEDELVLLNAHGRAYGHCHDDPFSDVKRPHPTHLNSSMEDIEHEHLYESGPKHLLRMGLLRKNYGNVKRGQVPDFDPRAGDFAHSVEISQLGRMLLKEIGMPTTFDIEQGYA
ncbi:hypothetical protein ACW17M_19430 [Vreelandella sp. 2A-K22]